MGGRWPDSLIQSVVVLSTAFNLMPTSVSAAHTSASARPASDYGLPQVRVINQQIRAGWEEHSVRPSKPASDQQWCRRVYLDVIGRIPTVEELTAFLKERPSQRRELLVGALLYDDRYREEYVRHWSTIWCNILIGRSGGSERNSLTSREGMLQYLREVFEENRPYDQMVHQLISAKGTNVPGTPEFNGAVNFLTMKLGENAAQATAQTSSVFLGLQIQCTQCHNHPFNEWKQKKFWELNSFFRQAVALRRFESGSRNIRFVQLDDQDFGGEGSTAQDAEVYYELRNGYLKPAYPIFVDGQEIGRSGYVDEVNRRDELARLVAGSPWLSKAQANRHWAQFLGYGFTKPVNDLGPHNSPSHPDLLNYLADQFKGNSFDLKKLTRWIVLSEAYSLSSQTNKENEADDPLLGETPKFSHFYLRQMSAEQVYESLLVATEADRTGSPGEQIEDRQRWLRQFVTAFGTDEGDESTTFDGTIPQTLMMFNGDLIKRAIDTSKGGMLGSVVASNSRAPAKIRHLFAAALSRQPTQRELNIANQLLVASRGNVSDCLQDIWWAILNSNEFILNH